MNHYVNLPNPVVGRGLGQYSPGLHYDVVQQMEGDMYNVDDMLALPKERLIEYIYSFGHQIRDMASIIENLQNDYSKVVADVADLMIKSIEMQKKVDITTMTPYGIFAVGKV